MAVPVADLTGATVIVAGAGGGGIGTCSCEAALAAGADVVAVDQSSDELDKLDLLSRPVVKVQADLTKPDAPTPSVQCCTQMPTAASTGSINVPPAGLASTTSVLWWNIDHQGWDRVHANNLR